MKENLKPIFVGIMLTIFVISIMLNINTYNTNGFQFGGISIEENTSNKKVANFSGVGYNKKQAEKMLQLVESVNNER